MTPDAQEKRSLTRFSLLNFILACLLAGALVALGVVNNRLQKANAENRELRDQLGFLHVEDPTKIHFRSLNEIEKLHWRWRVHMPEGKEFWLRVAFHDIPQGDIPTGPAQGGKISYPAGEEFMMEAKVYVDSQGQWKFAVAYPTGGAEMTVQKQHTGWLVRPVGHSMDVAGSRETVVADPEKPFVLLRYRSYKPLPGGGGQTDHNPCPGLMVWLDPAK